MNVIDVSPAPIPRAARVSFLITKELFDDSHKDMGRDIGEAIYHSLFEFFQREENPIRDRMAEILGWTIDSDHHGEYYADKEGLWVEERYFDPFDIADNQWDDSIREAYLQAKEEVDHGSADTRAHSED